MAYYIKSLTINDQRSGNDTKDKLTAKEEEKKTVPSAMGDFEYHNPPVDLTDELQEAEFEEISRKTKSLVHKIDHELALNNEERKCLENRLNSFEEELRKRKNLYDICTTMFKDEVREIEKYSQSIERFDNAINHHEEVLVSWQCLIDDFRKIPEECL